MPQKPNTALRIIVPLVMIVVGILLAYAVFRNTVQQSGQQPQPTPTPTPQQPAAGPSMPGQGTQAAEATEATETQEPAPEPDQAAGVEDAEEPGAETPPGDSTPTISQAPTAAGGASVAAPVGLRPRVVPAQTFEPIGSEDLDGDYQLYIEFAEQDAGIEELILPKQFESVRRVNQELIQEAFKPTGGFVAPFGALAAEIGAGDTSTEVGVGFTAMQALGGPVWEQLGPGYFRAVIEDENGAPVLEITRRFIVQPGSFDLRLEQKLTNLSGGVLPVRWFQWGPVDLPKGVIRYGGDKRRVRFGYLRSPTSTLVETSDRAPGFYARGGIVKGDPQRVIWPNDKSARYNLSLAWAGLTNRYFALAAHPWLDPSKGGAAALTPIETVDRFLVGTAQRAEDKTVILRFVSPAARLAPGETLDLSFGVYAGPLSIEQLNPASEPVAAAAQLDKVVIYTFGGPCAFCTFQWLAVPLRTYLGFLDRFLVYDWALAIIVLVLTVRTLLHPITKFSQVRMLKFGKQMQAMGPKMQKLKDKYGHDQAKFREEMMRLQREEGMNYGQALGCLPLFLQTPIWIALYAMLFFTFELRHEGAFFGVFQTITFGGKPWSFLGDLAEPDQFITLGTSIHIPLLSNMMGSITAFNILPLVYAGVFFVHQKFLTPPTTATLSPEQESAQKMARYMPLVLFPIFIYNAPSGLALYFICNSMLAIIESKLIRKKAERIMEEEEKNPKKKKKKGKGGGETFMQRFMRLAEERRKMVEEARGVSERGGRSAGRGGGRSGRGRR